MSIARLGIFSLGRDRVVGGKWERSLPENSLKVPSRHSLDITMEKLGKPQLSRVLSESEVMLLDLFVNFCTYH